VPRKNRLTGAEIRGLRSPRRIHGDFFSVLVAPSAGKQPKCACVVSKKIALKAHDRNLIKRRCRAAVAKGISTLPAGAYVFHAKKDAPKAAFRDIDRDVAAILKQLARS
jgi:ribonuclease P protein component